MKTKTIIVAFIFALGPTVGWSAASSSLIVTPEFIVATAMQHADEIDLIENETTNFGAAVKNVEAAFVTTVDGKLSLLDSRAETNQPFSPSRNRSRNLLLGVSRLYETGTLLRGELSTFQTDMEFDAPSPAEGLAHETQLAVSLRQNFLRNGLGKSIRSQRLAFEKADSATLASVADRKSQYALQVSGMFFTTWQAIAQVRAAEKQLEKQRDLLKVTKIKYERGTAERPDFLQVDAAVAMIEDRVKDARNTVDDVWQQLVTILKLPQKYVEMDPMNVPIDLGNALQTIPETCEKAAVEGFSRTKAAALAIEATDASLNALRMDARPDLYLEARISQNGIDKRFDESSGEALAGKNPHFSVAVGFEMPLGYPRFDASTLDSIKQRNANTIRIAQIKSQYETERPILCAEVRRLEEKKRVMQDILKKQQLRAKLERDRFRLGKIESFNVIQAENDVTDVQTNLDVLMSQLHHTAWKLLYLNDRLDDYIEAYSREATAQ